MASTPTIGVKISKKTLLRKLEQERVKAIARFERAEKSYQSRLGRWQKKSAAKCTKAAQDFLAGKLDPKPGERYYSRESVGIDTPPIAPKRDEYVAHWDRTIDWASKALNDEFTLHRDAYERLVYGRPLSS